MTEAGTGGAVIVARGLTKTYQTTVREPGLTGAVRSLLAPRRAEKTAAADITFEVGRGELLALLGPNGAGKSTTIKMLTGIVRPTAGSATVAGVVPYRERERNARNIGVVFGQRTQLWWDLPVRESFAILGDIYGVGKAALRARLDEFDALLELSAFWDTRVRHLSLGQRVRCDLAAALLHDPRVLFLDEPTIGMDVVVKEQVRNFLRHQVEERDRAVLLTTHDMTEVARLAGRVVLINHGRIVLDGTLAEIRRAFGGGWRIRATVAEKADPVDGPVPAANPAGIRVVAGDAPGELLFGPDGDRALTVSEALKVVVGRYDVVDVAIEESDLEDVMRAAYLSREVGSGLLAASASAPALAGSR